MGKCVKGETWSSFRPGKPDDGEFEITKIDGSGAFTGTHDGDPISGTCKGNTIEFTRDGSEKLWYSGEYKSEKRIQGVCTPLPQLTKRNLLPVDDDWVAVKTT